VKTVFTNGCFDILHRGHVDYLQASRALGDRLVVGINSDASVRRLKGSRRPINDQHSRVAVLSALRCVDQVIVFEQDTPYELICQLRPSIITKGGDYEPNQVVGADLAPVVIIPIKYPVSTTQIINACY
jgi:D-beta-D-heptose 7-phosphate kinase / D-beta-D-heptose 1-phosphate adenosyltransferase